MISLHSHCPREPFTTIGHTHLYTTQFHRYPRTHNLGCYLTAASHTLPRLIPWYLTWYIATVLLWYLATVFYGETMLVYQDVSDLSHIRILGPSAKEKNRKVSQNPIILNNSEIQFTLQIITHQKVHNMKVQREVLNESMNDKCRYAFILNNRPESSEP